MPKVSVVIVSWNVRDLLHQALSSLERETTTIDFETIVVDNASSDGTTGFVEKEWPRVRLVSSPTNLGFGAGNNLGFRACTGEYILLLNPDTIVLPTTVRGLADFLDIHPDTGCVGCRHLNEDLSLQRSIGHFPSLLEDFLAYTELHRLALLQPFLRRRFAYWGSYDRIRRVNWVNGSCMMVRRQVIEHVGGLDEGYYMYAEEIDWCYRMERAGWEVHYTPEAELVHLGGQAMNRFPDQRVFLKITSQYRFFRKFHPVWRCATWRSMVSLVALGRMALLSLLILPSRLSRVRQAIQSSWWEVLTREPVVTQPIVAIKVWWRIFVFAAIRPKMSNRPKNTTP